jgi:hypothetical protein
MLTEGMRSWLLLDYVLTLLVKAIIRDMLVLGGVLAFGALKASSQGILRASRV